MVDSEQYIVAMTHVVHAKVDAGLVGSRPYHQMHHGFRDIYAVLSLHTLIFSRVLMIVTLGFTTLYRLLLLSTSIVPHFYVHVLLNHVTIHRVLLLYLVEVLGHSVLPPVFRLCLS